MELDEVGEGLDFFPSTAAARCCRDCDDDDDDEDIAETRPAVDADVVTGDADVAANERTTEADEVKDAVLELRTSPPPRTEEVARVTRRG